MRLFYLTLILICPYALLSQAPVAPTPSVLPNVTLQPPGSTTFPAGPTTQTLIQIPNAQQSMTAQHRAIIAEVDEYIQKKQAHDRRVQQLIDDAYATTRSSINYA
ncbi:MAG: hypothetical protein AAFO69_20540, partial [Bacteroidota bacterium]